MNRREFMRAAAGAVASASSAMAVGAALPGVDGNTPMTPMAMQVLELGPITCIPRLGAKYPLDQWMGMIPKLDDSVEVVNWEKIMRKNKDGTTDVDIRIAGLKLEGRSMVSVKTPETKEELGIVVKLMDPEASGLPKNFFHVDVGNTKRSMHEHLEVVDIIASEFEA